MKLTLGLTAALAGCVAAAQQAAEVFIFPSADGATTTQPIPRSLARLVLLQRLAPAGKGPSIADIPDGTDPETVVAMMNDFGKEPASLFGEGEPASPSQLVVMLEGLTAEQIQDLRIVLGSESAFTIADPPSAAAHDKLVKNDFYNVGITNEHKCSVKEVSNPFEERCWSGKSTVARYNVQKQPGVLGDISGQVSSLVALAKSGEMETTVVLLPASGQAKQWSDSTQELRRRQSPAEQVISAYDDKPSQSDSPTSTKQDDGDTAFYASKGASIPACFASKDSCSTSTGNCSGHGECQNQYANPDGSEGKEACYVCHCLSTVSDSGSLTHWAGSTCAKKDVSVPFWLFFGFTLAMVGILSLSVGMLFGVGEEKLPGVIGAGVSKSK